MTDTRTRNRIRRLTLAPFATLCALALATAACAGPKLTREKAEELIRAKSAFPIKDGQIKFMLSWDNYCFQISDTPCGPANMPPPLKKLEDSHLISVVYDGLTSRISLTPEGQKFALGGNESHTGESGGRFGTVVEVPMLASTLEFGTITGMTEADGSKPARAEYFVLRNPTPFGENLTGNNSGAEMARRFAPGTIHMVATLSKYDDGWRVTQIGEQ
jgi:hypothetical protein